MKTNLHRCKFVDLDVGCINCIAISPVVEGQEVRVAVARKSGAIDIYVVADDESGTVSFDRTISGDSQLHITKLIWVNHPSGPLRLISVGLSGLIIDWDIAYLRPKRCFNSFGGGVWSASLSPDNSRLAIGCEDGGIRIFDVTDDNLEMVKQFDQKLKRILCLDWFKDGKHIISGNDSTTVEKWDVYSGKMVLSMRVEFGNRWRENPVWDVKVLCDNTIASADSRGNVTLFDGEFGTVIYTFKSHETDVLTLAVNKAGTELYSAGVDSKINKYILSRVDGILKWSIHANRRFHFNDTKSIALLETAKQSRLFSGGLDMRLSWLTMNPFSSGKFQCLNAFPSSNLTSFSPVKRWVMSQFKDSLKIWQLGSSEGKKDIVKDDDEMDPKEKYQRVMSIVSESTRNISASAMSFDGQFIVFGDVDSIRLFQIRVEDETPILNRISDFPPKSYFDMVDKHGASGAKFIFTQEELIVATVGGDLISFELNNLTQPRKLVNPFTDMIKQGHTFKDLTVDINGQYLTFTHTGNLGAVLDIATGEPVFMIPYSTHAIAGIKLTSTAQLIVVDTHWQIQTYDIQLNAPSLNGYSSPKVPPMARTPQLALHPETDLLLLYDARHLTPTHPDGPVPFGEPNIHHFAEIMAISLFPGNDMVVLERNYDDVLATLPPAFKSKIYTGQHNDVKHL